MSDPTPTIRRDPDGMLDEIVATAATVHLERELGSMFGGMVILRMEALGVVMVGKGAVEAR